MENMFIIIVFTLLYLLCMFIIALPLYIAVNLVCWVFHLTFHLTLLQAFVVTLLGNVIHNILFKSKEG